MKHAQSKQAREARTAENSILLTFGSCYGFFDMENEIFETIDKDDSDLWVWLGDVTYLDYNSFWGSAPQTPANVKYRYDKTKGAQGYADLNATSKIIGVWDDHDFGENDGGKEFELKH